MNSAYSLGHLPLQPLLEWLTQAEARLPLGPSDTLTFSYPQQHHGLGGAGYVLHRPSTDTCLCDVLDGAAGQAEAAMPSSAPWTRGAVMGSLPVSTRWACVLASTWLDPTLHLSVKDGRRRVLVMLAALLREVMDAEASNGLTMCTRRYAIVERGGEPGVTTRFASEWRRFMLVLKALVSGQAFLKVLPPRQQQCTDTSSFSSTVAEVELIAYAVQETLKGLNSSGDLLSLSPSLLSGIGGFKKVVRGVVHHVLATEVEGVALEALEGLLVGYLFSFLDSPKTADASSGVKEAWAAVVARLRVLCEYPQLVLLGATGRHARTTNTCHSPFISASRTTTPQFMGPVSSSQLLSERVLLLPCESCASRGITGTETPLFYLPMKEETTTATATTTTTNSRRTSNSDMDDPPLRVLLVRIDPDGFWHGPEEETYNMQTFASFYQNDRHLEAAQVAASRRRRERRRRLACGDDSEGEEDIEESFMALEARSAGARHVLHPHGASESIEQHSADDQLVMDICEALFLSTYDAGSLEIVQLTAAVRLYTLALRHGISIVLTPERAPVVLKRFGVGLHCQLLAHYLATRGLLPHTVAIASPSSWRVYMVDEIRLEAFNNLLARVPRRHSTNSSNSTGGVVDSSPVVLCREALRLPAVLSDAILDSSQCVVLSRDLLFSGRATVGEVCASPALFVGSMRRTLGKERVCVLVLAEQATTSDVRSDVGSTEVVFWRLPPKTMLLVAPTVWHVATYETLLGKCARSLLSAFAEGGDGSGSLVRAGGCFYIALASTLRRLAAALRLSVSKDADGTLLCVNVRDAPMLAYVVECLCSALLSVPQRLARRVIQSPSRFSLSDEPTTTSGPRARQRLWSEALAQVVSLSHSSDSPSLHVYALSLAEETTALLAHHQYHYHQQQGVTGNEAHDILEEARHIYGAERVGSEAGFDGVFPFVESVEGNSEAVRETLHALWMVMTAAGAAGAGL